MVPVAPVVFAVLAAAVSDGFGETPKGVAPPNGEAPVPTAFPLPLAVVVLPMENRFPPPLPVAAVAVLSGDEVQEGRFTSPLTTPSFTPPKLGAGDVDAAAPVVVSEVVAALSPQVRSPTGGALFPTEANIGAPSDLGAGGSESVPAELAEKLKGLPAAPPPPPELPAVASAPVGFAVADTLDAAPPKPPNPPPPPVLKLKTPADDECGGEATAPAE